MGGFGFSDGERDSARAFVDIAQVVVDFPSQPHWRIRLAEAPPTADTLDPTRTVVSYGLTFETTGDGVADYVVGISNAASTPGEFLVWVTDLVTGDTREQDGGPYGLPVEFAHPDERTADEMPTPEMLFTFLPGSRPSGVGMAARFYAWASVEEGGEIVAWDYAPDAGWVGAPPEAAASEAAAVPVAAVHPDAPEGLPECRAQEFDFIGEGTLRELGLHEATPVMPDGIDRVGRIWVTRDLMPYDPGPPGGPERRTRMLCWEFPDGSGGSGWPVDPAWQPPGRFASVFDGSGLELSPALPAVALLALLLLAVSVLAFRGRR